MRAVISTVSESELVPHMALEIGLASTPSFWSIALATV